MKFKCAMCKKELEKPGAIVLSPPSDAQHIDVCEVTKFHICCDCYSLGIFQLITNPFYGVTKAKKQLSAKVEKDEKEVGEYWTTFTGAGGYSNERKRAAEVFEVGKLYRIAGGNIGNNVTYLKLYGVKGAWNSCLFDADIDKVSILVNDCTDK